MSALLALSDVLVIRALERCYSRGLPGDARRRAAGVGRHHAYEHVRIPIARHGHALDDAWSILPEIVESWDLPIDADDWARVLDDYCRQLLTTQRRHRRETLAEALQLLGAGYTL